MPAGKIKATSGWVKQTKQMDKRAKRRVSARQKARPEIGEVDIYKYEELAKEARDRHNRLTSRLVIVTSLLGLAAWWPYLAGHGTTVWAALDGLLTYLHKFSMWEIPFFATGLLAVVAACFITIRYKQNLGLGLLAGVLVIMGLAG